MEAWRISGRVADGLGQGAGFTGLEWVRAGFLERLGIDPWPGTLNLRLDDPRDQATWASLRATAGVNFPAADPGACDARCYPVRVAGRLPAAIVLPEVPGYPADQVELVAAVGLREALGVTAGDRLRLDAADRAPLDTVIFDVDGTLVNSVDAYHIAAGRAAEAFGYRVTHAMVREALNTQRPFWHLVLPPEEREDAERIRSLREATMRHWPAVLAEHVGVFHGVADTLSRLRDAGLRLAIYSGSHGESFAPLEKAGLLELFEVVLTARDVSEPKPHPEGLLSCMARLDARPAATAYIGDSVPDMQAAEAAGVLAVGVLTGAADSAALSRAGAHRLVASHQGLLELFRI